MMERLPDLPENVLGFRASACRESVPVHDHRRGRFQEALRKATTAGVPEPLDGVIEKLYA